MQILAIVMLALGGGGLTILMTPPVYTASAVLLLETQPPGLFRPNSVFSVNQIDQSLVETQVEVLRSSQLLLKVIDTMKLVEDPEFTRPVGFNIPGPIELVRYLAGQLIVWLFPQKEVAGLGGVEQPYPRADVLIALSKRLDINRVGSSNTILISYSANRPGLAAGLVNQIATIYISGQLACNQMHSQMTSDRSKIALSSPAPHRPSTRAGRARSSFFWEP